MSNDDERPTDRTCRVEKGDPDHVELAAVLAVLLARALAVPGVPEVPRTVPARWSRPEPGPRAMSGWRSVAP